MKHDFFKGSSSNYHVSNYFYRIEFQQRGAPHVHSLLWMKDKDGNDAPNFCFIPNESDEKSSPKNKNKTESDQILKRIQEVESLLTP